MFTLRGVRKSFGTVPALGPLDLEIAPGRTTVVIGPSGCGKSTLLRLMIGLLTPDAGTVRFADRPLTPDSAQALRRRMGYVIQEGGLFPHLSAAANVSLMARWLGWDRLRCEARMAELARLAHLPADALARHPQALSGGQRQRVALMRALMLDPEVLLLDEPLGALDPMIRFDLQAELRDIFRALRKTVVMVTHDLGEAAHFADHAVLLREGSIVQQGPLGDLVDRPADPFVERFVTAQRAPLAALDRSGAP
jgi:osmoprotectant transport system ATP-binding protein